MVRTIVTREPEWDDVEAAKMQGLVQYRSEVCECGLHESVADKDPELELVPRRCPVCASKDQAMRQIAAQDDKALARLGQSPPPEAERPTDGRFFGLRQKVSPEVARLMKALGR